MKKRSLKVRLAQRVKKLRKDKKLSQEELAAEIGKTLDTISHIERGIYLPKLETAEDIADALDVELYELFVQDISETDKTKVKLFNQIVDLLNDQPVDLLKMTLEQVKSFVALKDSFRSRLKK